MEVADKFLFRDVHELEDAVASAGDEVFAIEGEGAAEGPVGVVIELEELFAIRHGDDAHGALGAAADERLLVGRPIHAKERITSESEGFCQFSSGHFPNLHLAEEARAATGGGEIFAVRREGEGLDARGVAGQSCGDGGAVGLVQNDLVMGGDGEKAAVGREGEGGDGRRGRIGERSGGFGETGRRVIVRALLNPAFKERHFDGGKRRAFGGHRRFLAADFLDDEAVLGVAGLEAGAVLAAFLEGLVGRQVEVALEFARVVATVAAPAKNGGDLLVKAGRLGRGRERSGEE